MPRFIGRIKFPKAVVSMYGDNWPFKQKGIAEKVLMLAERPRSQDDFMETTLSGKELTLSLDVSYYVAADFKQTSSVPADIAIEIWPVQYGDATADELDWPELIADLKKAGCE